MATVNRFDITLDLVDAVSSLTDSFSEGKNFFHLERSKQTRIVLEVLTMTVQAANAGYALQDNSFYHLGDGLVGVGRLALAGGEVYQNSVSTDVCKKKSLFSLVAKIARAAASIFTTFSVLLPPLTPIFTAVKLSSLIALQIDRLSIPVLFSDMRTDPNLPFLEEEEDQFCKWVGCFGDRQQDLLCSIAKRFILEPATYPNSWVKVDLGSVEELRKKRITEIKINGDVFILENFSKAGSKKIAKARDNYIIYRKLYGQSILLQKQLKKSVDNNSFAEVPKGLLEGYSPLLKICSLTGKVIRSLAFPQNSSNVFYEKNALCDALTSTTKNLPPGWPKELSFSRENICISGTLCEQYEVTAVRLQREISASLAVIENAKPTLGRKFTYYKKHYFWKGILNSR